MLYGLMLPYGPTAGLVTYNWYLWTNRWTGYKKTDVLWTNRWAGYIKLMLYGIMHGPTTGLVTYNWCPIDQPLVWLHKTDVRTNAVLWTNRWAGYIYNWSWPEVTKHQLAVDHDQYTTSGQDDLLILTITMWTYMCCSWNYVLII